MSIDEETTNMPPPPLYTTQPSLHIDVETMNPSGPEIILATPKLITERHTFRRNKQAYQIPIKLIQRSPLPSYAASIPPSTASPHSTTTASSQGLETPSEPPKYSLVGKHTPTNPPIHPLSPITDPNKQTSMLLLPLGSSPGYLSPLSHRTLLSHIQRALETQRITPLTSDLICQCEIHLWISTPAQTDPENPSHLQQTPERNPKRVAREERPANQTDLTIRIEQSSWDHENRGRRMLERAIREGRVCGFEVYWWVKDDSVSAAI